MKKLLVIMLVVIVIICVPVILLHIQGNKKAEIINSGFSADEDGNYTYAVEIQNNSDKVIMHAAYDIEAYDENGDVINPLGEVPFVKIFFVKPGEKAAAAYVVKSKQKEFEKTPADVAFKISFSQFSKNYSKGYDLKCNSFETDIPEGNAKEGTIYAVIENEGNEDFFFDANDWKNGDAYIGGTVVFKDEEGNILGGSKAHVMGGGSLVQQQIKAGEEVEIPFVFDCWQCDNIEFFLDVEPDDIVG